MRKSLVVLALIVGCSSSESSRATGEDAAEETSATLDSNTTTETTEPDTTVVADTTVEDTTMAMDVAPDVMMGRDYSTDRTKFFGASRCSTAKLALCEDFESGTLDTKTWTVNGTMPTIEGAERARGTKALHIKRAGNGNSYIKETKSRPSRAGSTPSPRCRGRADRIDRRGADRP